MGFAAFELSYQEVLAELLGVLGERVVVTAGGIAARGVSLSAAGTLGRAAPGPVETSAGGETLVFRVDVGERPGDGVVFSLSQDEFELADRIEGGIAIQSGGCLLVVRRSSDARDEGQPGEGGR